MEPNILVERGTDSSRLLIAFTGFQGALTMPPFDFFAASGQLGSSRILLRDPSRVLYLEGIAGEAPGLWGLVARLTTEIERLAPDRITCVGTSSGGYAAMLFGHLLGADRVHAFAPSAYASLWLSFLNRDWHQLTQRAMPHHLRFELFSPPSLWKYKNLPKILKHWNGRTEYTVHVCAHNEPDILRARVFRGLPHVQIAAHECSTHQVARHLVRERKLLEVFRD